MISDVTRPRVFIPLLLFGTAGMIFVYAGMFDEHDTLRLSSRSFLARTHSPSSDHYRQVLADQALLAARDADLKRVQLPAGRSEVDPRSNNFFHKAMNVQLSGSVAFQPRGTEREIWAQSSDGADKALADQVKAKLSSSEIEEIKQVCGRCLFGSLFKAVIQDSSGLYAHVKTGDIDSMWLRDSSVQVAIYVPYIAQEPSLRFVVEGTIRKLSRGIVADPYANSYSQGWLDPQSGQISGSMKRLRRGGWTGTGNFELDSGCYYLSLIWNYLNVPGLYDPAHFVREPLVYEAVNLMINTWIREQHHEEKSTYRYPEIERNGLGKPTGYTGMIWSGFRPSDDAAAYGYSIPGNMYAVGALERVLAINDAIWKQDDLNVRVTKLRDDVLKGIEKHGIVDVGGTKVYAYEVDGLGQALTDFDDANVPSLMSMPLLGNKHYDQQIYANTKARLLDPRHNRYYFKGSQLEGIGSPHTPGQNVWPMSMVIQGLTTSDVDTRVKQFRQLLKSQCGNGVMHESVNVNNPSSCTRMWFEWANALFVTYTRMALGIDCKDIAEEISFQKLGLPEDKRMFATLSNRIQWSNGGGTDAGWFHTRR